ncbi:hypothetical protein MJO28_005701 [Puccinia striiformis f. sp. tritici]|uniref:Uncharacterized protein n=2 Tax=Puccinia striiformis f. sp. tritici TaxID=168172 RepID=A0ACC0EPG2_9BASI|nr:hypothetical protein MJO28_005685 [Puccinia striiformis f. sp. tritici]KAI7955301.1 hypothetical protein MJO28_005701 [Puccinia striiformis f. sp. tritici]
MARSALSSSNRLLHLININICNGAVKTFHITSINQLPLINIVNKPVKFSSHELNNFKSLILKNKYSAIAPILSTFNQQAMVVHRFNLRFVKTNSAGGTQLFSQAHSVLNCVDCN